MNKYKSRDSNMNSKLLTHLYEYFGVLLGCTMEGKTGYPEYSGQASQGKVHKSVCPLSSMNRSSNNFIGL